MSVSVMACPRGSVLLGQVLYMSAMVRAVIALHDLVLNKLKFKGEEEERERGVSKEAPAAKEASAAAAAAAPKGKEESKEEK